MPKFSVVEIQGKVQSQICLCGPGMLDIFLGSIGDEPVTIIDDMVVGLFYQQSARSYRDRLRDFVSQKLNFGNLVVFTTPTFRNHDIDDDNQFWSFEDLIVAPFFSSVGGFREKCIVVLRCDSLTLCEGSSLGYDLINRFNLQRVKLPYREWVTHNRTSLKFDAAESQFVVSNRKSEKFRVINRTNFKVSG